ncbi:MAG: M4 family metallopeptidase [Thermoleophilia bacterium]|nr:M4 family metallopeptidase [Thermoleophilia bacterium]
MTNLPLQPRFANAAQLSARRAKDARGVKTAAAPRPDNAVLRATAMRAVLQAQQWFASFGLGTNDGVRAADIVITHKGLLNSDTSSNPSWMLDGRRTIRLGDFKGTNDALRADIVEHEYSHGVIERYITAKTPEANALNEALADVFAVAIENRDLDVDGRSLATGEGIWQISQVPVNGFGSSDNGGEHAMMGIATHPAYVVASQCGRPAMAAIYMRAMTNHVPAGAQNFAGFALATIQAAAELYGTQSVEYRAIWQGWNEVGLTRDTIAQRLSMSAGF